MPKREHAALHFHLFCHVLGVVKELERVLADGCAVDLEMEVEVGAEAVPCALPMAAERAFRALRCSGSRPESTVAMSMFPASVRTFTGNILEDVLKWFGNLVFQIVQFGKYFDLENRSSFQIV